MTDTAVSAPTSSLSDENSFGGRMMRYARVGTSVGTVAARFAGNRFLGLPLDQLDHATDLKQALGSLKGPLMKVAQILATIPDVMPEEYAEQLRQLQHNAPSMGWAFVKRRMTSELGPGWLAKFGSFEHHAAAAASLGQVHRATDHGGRSLACKLQYPDMGAAVEADLAQLKLVFSIYRRYDKALDPRKVHTELSERLREELDYDREARNMRLYGRMLTEAKDRVHVPEPVEDLSTRRLLTMTWLDGDPLLDMVDRDIECRNTIARNMFTAWYVPFYGYGVIHGDPHLGNYAVRADGSLNLLDFGCVRMFTPEFVGAVIHLYHALRTNDQDMAVHAYEIWGFDNINHELIEILNQWASFLYRPLMEDRVQPIQNEGGSQYGAEVLAKVHAELRRVGGVTPPREFVLMDRAAIGLGSVFTRLRAEVNWHQMFHGLIDGFDAEALRARQTAALEAEALPLPS